VTHRLFLAGIALVAVVPVGAAYADAGSANACAAGLAPSARAIYDAAAPGFAASNDPRGLVKATTMNLVQAGTIPMSEARADATAAGACLKKLR